MRKARRIHDLYIFQEGDQFFIGKYKKSKIEMIIPKGLEIVHSKTPIFSDTGFLPPKKRMEKFYFTI